MPTRILLISNDMVGPHMAGPAIRYWEFAKVLSRYFEVTLAIPPIGEPQSLPQTTDFALQQCETRGELEQLTQQTEVIITVGANVSVYPFITQSGKPLVVDMYIPSVLEGLQRQINQPLLKQLHDYQNYWQIHAQQLQAADFLICASEKQRDYWLGWLTALGRVNPYTHQADSTLNNLIDVVPFGLPKTPPQLDRPVLKGVYKTIAQHDKVILWGGGIWNWLDWRTAIEAMSQIRQVDSNIKLFFMGTKRPKLVSNPIDAVTEAINLSKQLGLYDQTIFFNEWVLYQERHNYLLEADLGLNLHPNHIETRFAFRTRMLDYIWCGLPIITTAGDVMSDEVARLNLGQVVQCGDVTQVSQTILRLLKDQNLRQTYQPMFASARQQYYWETVMQPLIRFCQHPYQAVDKPHHAILQAQLYQAISAKTPLQKAWFILKHKGILSLVSEIRRYIQWKQQK